MKLFPFQEVGRDHLARNRIALLADEMGLGKTIQALRASEEHTDRCTVICPAILAAEWREVSLAEQDVPRAVAVVGERRGPDPATAGLAICSYDRAAKPEVAALLRSRGGHLILDESHYLKEPESKRTLAVLTDAGSIASEADRVSFLTGTPCPNHAGELFPMLATAGIWRGDYWSFLTNFCHVRETPFGPRVTGYRNAAGLRDMLGGFMLRRTNAVELPPTERGEIVVEPRDCGGEQIIRALRALDPLAASLIKRAATIESFDDLDTPHVATLRRLVGLAKVDATADRARALLEADPSNKLVLFCLHRQVMLHLLAKLRDFGPVLLAGGESDVARKAAKDSFQANPFTRVAVCQMKAAGTGLTLTAANHLWVVEPSWTPADNDQAVKRIVRIGQKRRTYINFVTLDTSIDRAVNAVLRRKRQLIDEIMV
jgi:SWI/SNF-related matrix-associated actin-dependent regulator 1 of chromatin subfamily A